MPETTGDAVVRPGEEGHICEHDALSSCLTPHGLRLGISPLSMLVNCTVRGNMQPGPTLLVSSAT